MGFGKDGKGVIIHDSVNNLDIGALAARDCVLITNRMGGTLVEDFRMIKTEYFLGIRPSQTTTLFGGPILIGVAYGDLIAAEIEEALESVVLGQGDLPAIEEAMRPVWPLEIILMPDADLGNSSDLTRKGEFSPRWTFPNPSGWRWWVYNMSTVALVAGNGISVQSKSFGVWVV